MSTSHPLDNPIWQALAGPHVPLSIARGAARHYRFDVAPFSAIVDRTVEAYNDLAVDLRPRLEARLFRSQEEPAPHGWETVNAKPMLQMVLENEAALGHLNSNSEEIVSLFEEDTDAMLDLAETTKPGPFSRGRLLLGQHVGVKREGRLIAMAGPRLRLTGFRELSAICVCPEARKTGLGGALTRVLARKFLMEGDTPFLHVFTDNPAIDLYSRLGFRTRKKLWVLWYRPLDYAKAEWPIRPSQSLCDTL